MHDENKPLDEVEDVTDEMTPGHEFADALFKLMGNRSPSTSKIRECMAGCLAVAEAMVAETRQEIGFEISALTNMVRDRDIENGGLKDDLARMTANFHEAQNEVAQIQERYEAKCKELDKAEETYTSAVLLATELTEIGELKARITELEAEANEDRKIKNDFEKELSETRAIYNRMASEHEVVKRDAAQFRTRTATAEEHARKLYDVIESLASIGRNL